MKQKGFLGISEKGWVWLGIGVISIWVWVQIFKLFL